MTMRLVNVSETDLVTIRRYESSDGFAITMYREKAAPPAITLPSPLGRMYAIGAAEVQRLEANAASDNEAAEIATAWDQQWRHEVTA